MNEWMDGRMNASSRLVSGPTDSVTCLVPIALASHPVPPVPVHYRFVDTRTFISTGAIPRIQAVFLGDIVRARALYIQGRSTRSMGSIR